MSEALDQVVEEQVPGEEPSPQPSAGALLRAAREAAGLHIAALAVSLKVPVKKLEALEADRLDLLPDAVFVRGLASSVCRALKVDPAPVLAQLPQTNAPRLRPDEYGLNTPFTAPGDATRASVLEQLSKPGILAALVFLVGALVLIFFPSMESSDKEAGGKTRSEVVELSAPQILPAPPAPVAAGAIVEVPLSSSVPAPAVAENPVPAKVVNPPAPAVSVQPAALVPSVAAPPQPAAVTGSSLMLFKARGPSWVEVTDSQGVVQLRRTLVAGETVGAGGALPLSVVIGRVDAMEVQVRGKPFSLDAVARENVARFEVK